MLEYLKIYLRVRIFSNLLKDYWTGNFNYQLMCITPYALENSIVIVHKNYL